MLLSLIENFFDRDEIEKEKLWKIVHYDALRTGIDNNYKGVIGKDATYISDYCSFISNMHSLQQKIVPGNFINEELWPDYELYKQYRLHDLYIKLRGLKFIELLQAKFCNAGLSYEIVPVGGFKFRQSWNPGQKKDVYLNWNVFRAVGQVAVYLYNGGEQIFEIVIQGDQYRHGINYYDPKDKNISLQDIWKKVKNGLSALGEGCNLVAIHDGVRPLVSATMIERGLECANSGGSAIPTVGAVDSFRISTNEGLKVIDRSLLRAVQTPQIFDIKIYKDAMKRAFRELSDWTDDSRIFENDARKVFLTPGKKYNIKITSPEDILIAEALLKGREEE